MNSSVFVFQNGAVDSNSVTEHASGTNLDFFTVPASSLTSISALEGKVVLYFKSSNSFENSKANQAQITLTTDTGAEAFVAVAIWTLVMTPADPVLGSRFYTFDDTKSTYAVSRVSGVDSIVRPTAERFSSGSSLPSGGVLEQVLIKQSATDGDAAWDYPHTLYVPVRNTSGGTLTKGTPVHATGVTGDVADVIAADASSAAAMPATYVLNEDTLNNEQGLAIILGVIEGVDTSSFSAGDKIYVASGGGFTNVKPTGTNLIQNLGVVTKSNASTGSGVVYGAGRSNDVPNLPAGKFFIGSATNTAESAYTLPTADGSADQFLKTDGAGAVTFTAITQATGNELENVVEDTTPQLGGNLDAQSNNITNLGSLNGTAASKIISRSLTVACSDETSDLTTGTAKATFRMPEAATITGVRASVTTAPAGSVLTVDINEAGTTILSTKLTIDAGEKTSTTAATAAVISDTSIADDAEMTIDIDAIGSSTAGAGLKVTIYYNPA